MLLFDIDSTLAPDFWSPNTGKIRTLLNYHGVAYDVEMLTYPNIEPKLRSLGVKSWSERGVKSRIEYTLPTVKFDDGEIVMGGAYYIVDKLIESKNLDIWRGEEKFGRVSDDYVEIIWEGMIGTITIPFTYNLLTDDESRDYFRATRRPQFKDFEGLQAKANAHSYDELLEEMSSFRALYDFCDSRNVSSVKGKLELFLKGESKFVLGDEASYLDFLMYGTILWIRATTKGGAPELSLPVLWENWYERLNNC